jgi:predicted transcriptional regulator
MKMIELNQLSNFISLLQERIEGNLKLAETHLMEIIQFYLESENKNIIKQLEGIKKKLFKLRDKIKNYRVPPIISKSTPSDSINQSIIVIFYFELILIESQIIIDNFQAITLEINIIPKVIKGIDQFSEFYNKINSFLNQLNAFDKLSQFDENIFNAIWIKVKSHYKKPDNVKRILKLCKQLKLLDIEGMHIANIYNDKKPITSRVFNIASARSQLIDIISNLGETPMLDELGGVISLGKLYQIIKDENPALDFSINDLLKVLNNLVKKGLISKIQEVDNLKLIQFKSIELTKDPIKLLEIVDLEGFDTKENLMKKLNWTESRVENVLDFLIKKGICKPGEKAFTGTKYYFPGLQK